MMAESAATGVTPQATMDEDRDAIRSLHAAFVAADSPAGVNVTMRLHVDDVVVPPPRCGAIESRMGLCWFRGGVLTDVHTENASPRRPRETCR